MCYTSFPTSFNSVIGVMIVVGVLHFLPHFIQLCYWGDDSGRCVALPSPHHSTCYWGDDSGRCVTLPCCCCCRPHSTNVLPAESSTQNHVAASSLSPQVARKGSTLSGFVQRSRLEREVGRDLHSNKWEEV